jgi:hypothetical protein
MSSTIPAAAGKDHLMFVSMAELTRRVDHLERANRRWKRCNALVLIGALLLLSGGVECPGTIEAEPVSPQGENATACTLLAEARIRLAFKALNSIKQRISSGKGCPNRDALVCGWSRRLLFAQIELSRGHVDRVASLEAHLVRMRDLEGRANAHYGERRISDLELMEAEYHRRVAESWLAREKSWLKQKRGQEPWTLEVND